MLFPSLSLVKDVKVLVVLKKRALWSSYPMYTAWYFPFYHSHSKCLCDLMTLIYVTIWTMTMTTDGQTARLLV